MEHRRYQKHHQGLTVVVFGHQPGQDPKVYPAYRHKFRAAYRSGIHQVVQEHYWYGTRSEHGHEGTLGGLNDGCQPALFVVLSQTGLIGSNA